MPNRLTDSLDFQAQALALRSQRQQLLASNIANADTPGYVARDMNFAQALQRATGTLASAQVLAATRPGHIAGAAPAGGGADLVYATQSQTNLDRNTVDMDRERASFADNALRYEATLRFINGQVRTLTSAITGQ
ncbi:MAG TPA: flagellar basal body rod protein FlgB [Burkholderiaceae bacterium]|nr:flagellar basal body rod protein FlgB [Burkholderiaceae bacterium]